jgi:hypothetical protein
MDDDDYYDTDDDAYNSDIDSSDSEKEVAIKNLPNFISKGSTFTVDKGTTIRLPCYVDKLPSEYMNKQRCHQGQIR